MDYSIYKDDSVSSTVNRISKILNNLGIELEESFTELPASIANNCKNIPYSERVKLFGIEAIGTNGKGTTKENCRASAFAEFMERLQNQSLQYNVFQLSSDKFFFAPDEQEFNKDTENFLSKYNYGEIISVRQPKKVCVPYYNVRDNKLHHLPLLKYAFSANGMASGNTPEEALVQGFSEICERYAHKQTLFNRIAMPDIPPKYYEKYERLKNLTDYTKQIGWEIHIKDASLGMGLPVVCAFFKNESEGFFTYKFGSQPSLPIAIERCITEFFQGQTLTKENLRNFTLHLEDTSVEGLKLQFPMINRRTWFFETSSDIYNIFFSNNDIGYKFSAKSWVDENKKYTNKELLKFVVDKIKNITNNDIYIRDVSYLNFPAYHIFIPEISEVVFYNDKKLNMHRWFEYTEDNETFSYNVDSLTEAILFKLKYSPMDRTFAPSIPDEILLILCYIVKNDLDNILKCCENLKGNREPNFVIKYSSLTKIIYHYFKLKQQNESKITIKNILNTIYNKTDVQRFYTLINNLDFDYIKNLISDSKKQEQIDMRTQAQQEIDNKINEITEKLIQKYIENTPNQMELAKVFDFSSIN